VDGGVEGSEIPLGELQLPFPQDGLAGLLLGGRTHKGRQDHALNGRGLDEQLFVVAGELEIKAIGGNSHRRPRQIKSMMRHFAVLIQLPHVNQGLLLAKQGGGVTL
jgi:hypothetical protein